jgi:hypothetical protein
MTIFISVILTFIIMMINIMVGMLLGDWLDRKFGIRHRDDN